MDFKLTNLRCAFPHLHEAKSVNDGEPMFSLATVIVPNSENHKILKEGMVAVAKDKWGNKADAILTELKSKGRVCFKESPLTKDGEPYEGFEGMFSLNASSKKRPVVVDKDKTPLTAADGKPYGGCYVDLSIEMWAQDNSWGKRINATIRWVQFRADGEAFSGGRAVSADEFAEIADGANAEALV